MKLKTSLIYLFIFFSFILLGISASAKNLDSIDACSIGRVIQEAVPINFGYVDNTDYYSGSYFSYLKGIDDCYIATSAESTNFNEFGIFRLHTKADVKMAKKELQAYLERRKAEFENGVIYNTEEYPKFQNASVFSVGNYVCYTILTPNDVKKASSAVKNMILE